MLPRKIQVGLALAVGTAVLLVLVSPAVPSVASVTQSRRQTPVAHAPATVALVLCAIWVLAPIATWPRESQAGAIGPDLIDFTCCRIC